MSVKTGGVGISPDIDKLLEMDSKSIEEYAATVMVSTILGRGNIGTVRGGSNTANQKNRTKNTKKNGNEVKRIENITGEKRMESEINNVNKKMAREAMIQYGVNPRDRDAAEEFYKSYQKLEAEYLVEGAMLTCTQATDKMISVYEKETINTETKEIIPMVIYEGNESDTETPLQNVENPAHDSNDSRYATVSDTKKLHNIFPFRNCKLSNASISNRKKIRANSTACQKYGTCYALMDLCEEWTNTLDSMKYGKPDSDMKSGINMKSHLGCYCGGVIYPIDSGQVEIEEDAAIIADSSWDNKKLVKWLADIEKPYLLDDYEVINDIKVAIRPHSANDGYVTIGFGHAIQSNEDAIKYGFETGQKQPISKVIESISKQMKKYSAYTLNPAILSFSAAEELLVQDLIIYLEKAIIFAEETGREYSNNEIDAMTSLIFNGNRAYDPDSLLYHFLNQDKTSALNVIRKADSEGWYSDHPGLLRRRLMEFNIFFYNDYKFYDENELSDLKAKTGF